MTQQKLTNRANEITKLIQSLCGTVINLCFLLISTGVLVVGIVLLTTSPQNSPQWIAGLVMTILGGVWACIGVLTFCCCLTIVITYIEC